MADYPTSHFFYYDEDTNILMPEEDGGLYDIAEFINYGIRITAAFLDYQKDLLQSDFDMLLMIVFRDWPQCASSLLSENTTSDQY